MIPYAKALADVASDELRHSNGGCHVAQGSRAGDGWPRALAQRGPEEIAEAQSTTKDIQDAANAANAKVVEDAEDAPGTLTCEMQIQMAGCLW